MSSTVPQVGTTQLKLGSRHPRAARGLVGALEAACVVLASAAAVYVVASTILMVADSALALPFSDQWGQLIFTPQQVLSAWLYSQDNEHRILFPRLIFAIDTFLFHENNDFGYICNIALTFALALLLTAVGARDLPSRSDRIWVGGAVFTALFSAMQWENFTLGYNVGFFLVELAAVANFTLVASGKPTSRKLAGAVASEAVAAYSLANGLLVPFIALALAIWLRRPKAHLAVLTVAALALAASYLYGYVTPKYHSDPLAFYQYPGAIAAYVISEIGNPVGAIIREWTLSNYLNWAQVCGAIGVVLFTAAFVAAVPRSKAIGASGPIFLATAAFVLGTAVLTALGRVRFGSDQAISSRYITVVLLFWVAMGLIGFVAVARHYSFPRLAVMTLGLCCLGIVAMSQPRFVSDGRGWILPRREATTALLADVLDAEMLAKVNPNVPKLVDIAAQLRAGNLSLFGDPWSGWINTPLIEHTRIGDQSRCRGAVTVATRITGSDRPGWRASGWAWGNDRDAAPDKIVMTDEAGRVIGYGLAGFAPEAADLPHREGWRRSGWHGHFTEIEAAPVIAYALIDKERTACRLRSSLPGSAVPIHNQ
jgi:hypothetical protein